MKKQTIYDVASMADVSPGTVSRYLNGYELRDYNRKKVEATIEALGFEENILAKGLKSNKSMTIAVLLPELTGLFSLDILKALDRILGRNNYTMVIADYEKDSDLLSNRINIFRRRSIDGLIIFPLSFGDSCLESLRHCAADGIPVICMSDKIRNFPCDYIHGGNRAASRSAVENLLQNGHSNVRIVTGRPNTFVTNERLKGVEEAFATFNIPRNDKQIIWTDYTMNNARDFVLKELEEDPPTAFYCTSYYLTMGAVLAINKTDFRLGKDISLIGHDYYPGIEVITPSLTTVEHDLERLGTEAGRLMLTRIDKGIPQEPLDIEVPMSLNVRDSVFDITSAGERL